MRRRADRLKRAFETGRAGILLGYVEKEAGPGRSGGDMDSKTKK